MLKRLSAKREDEGFTLIELLVVIVILGILAAVVVFAVGGITDKGETAAKNTDDRTLRTAEETFMAKTPSGTTAVYGTEADLVGAKVLAGFSTTHNVCLRLSTATPLDTTVHKKSYRVVSSTVVTAANCATDAADGSVAAEWSIVSS